MHYNGHMCGRFTLRASASVIAEQFALFELPPFTARFNIAPSQPVPVIRLRPEQRAPQRELVWLQWGLIPSWAESPALGSRLLNARAESAAEKPAFRTALRRRRCLVVADGFYEWQTTDKAKQPYFIHLRDDRPFAFAGLWEAWESPDHAMLETCAVITTEPNELMRPIHNRMPVILPSDAYATWLNPAIQEPRRLASLLVPYSGDALQAHPVDSFVNTPSHDSPRCIEPATGL
jgi:putative SOS response-associated peptidase YedK